MARRRSFSRRRSPAPRRSYARRGAPAPRRAARSRSSSNTIRIVLAGDAQGAGIYRNPNGRGMQGAKLVMPGAPMPRRAKF